MSVDLVSAQEPLLNSPALEPHLTVTQVAQAWSCSEETVRRVFENEPGILVIAENKHKGKRRYRTIRMPLSVVERVYQRLRRVA